MTALSEASEPRAVTLSEAKGLIFGGAGTTVKNNRGVSSTVKLPVSKTGLGGSNPSAPASGKEARQTRDLGAAKNAAHSAARQGPSAPKEGASG